MKRATTCLLVLITISLLPIAAHAQTISPAASYQTLAANGSSKEDTTWAMSLPKLVTDGTYTYNLVNTGNDLYRPTIEVKRKQLGSTAPATTIWSKTNQFSAIGGLLIDKRGALHIFYFPLYSYDVYWSAFLKEDIAASPGSTTVTFTNGNFPIVSGYTGVCYNCRLGIHYDNPADTIHLSIDQGNTTVTPNISEVFYTNKVGTGSWQPLTKLFSFYNLPNGTQQTFYYPVLRVFGGKIHIFYTGNISDPTNASYRWFNGIRHYYKDLSGTTWNNEWVIGPFTSDKTYIVGNDSYVTPSGQLVFIGPYVENLGTPTQKLQLLAFVSSTGVGGWQQQVLIPDKNTSTCVTQTSDGKYNMFYTTNPTFNFAQSADGLNWIFYTLNQLSGFTFALDANCLEENNPTGLLSQPTTMVAGYDNTIGQHSLADGHSLVLAQINFPTPGDLNLDQKVDASDLTLLLADFGRTGTPGFAPTDIDANGVVNIFDYNLLVANFGSPFAPTPTPTSVPTPTPSGYVNVNLFGTGDPPTGSFTAPDVATVVLGVKVKPTVSGRVTGVRFHKASTNTGTHVGKLWTSTGTQLATANFSGESASGWQQVTFTSPVSVTANTTYVASVSVPVGHWTVKSFPTTDVVSGPLTAPVGSNGVYVYGGASSFPNSSINSNYYIDVLFSSP